MPLMVFLCLSIVQLCLLQQARLLTEYAAYSAARAGIVWNGNNERMRDAAILALLPSREAMPQGDSPVPGLVPLGRAYARFLETDGAFRRLDWGNAPKEVNGAPLSGLVRVDTVNPGSESPLHGSWKVEGGDAWEELDFDGVDAFPETTDAARLRKLFDLRREDGAERSLRAATVLSIRVRQWYELRVPVANAVFFLAWAAAASGAGQPGRPGLADVSAGERQVLWALANGAAASLGPGSSRRYFLPLSATYSMRMQSNFHRKWLMHRSKAEAFTAAGGQP